MAVKGEFCLFLIKRIIVWTCYIHIQIKIAEYEF
jgi:hypothetical protein